MKKIIINYKLTLEELFIKKTILKILRFTWLQNILSRQIYHIFGILDFLSLIKIRLKTILSTMFTNIIIWVKRLFVSVQPIFAIIFLVIPVFFGFWTFHFLRFILVESLLFSFLLHLFLIPLQMILNSYNKWDQDFLANTFSTWLHPRIIKHISLALVYPYIFGIYYSIIRYSRLGSEIFIDLSRLGPYQYYILFYSIIIPFLFIVYLPQITIAWKKVSSFRDYFWKQTTDLFYSWYIYLLSKKMIFFCIEKLYKTIYYLAHRLGVYNITYFHITGKGKDFHYANNVSLPWYRYVISHIFYNFLTVITILVVFSLFIEFLLTKGYICFGLYILFIAPVIRTLWYLWKSLALSRFVVDCCLSDYLYTNWNKPKFVEDFPSLVRNADLFFPIPVTLNKSEMAKLTEIEKSAPHKGWGFRKNTSPVRHRLQLVHRVRNHPWAVRFCANYYEHHNKRFFHSSAHLCAPLKVPPTPWKGITPLPKPLHPGTAALCKTPMQKIAMFNSDHTFYQPITMIEKRFGGTPLHKETFVPGMGGW